MQNAQQYNPGFESQNLFQMNFDWALCATTPTTVSSFSRPHPARGKTSRSSGRLRVRERRFRCGIAGTIFREGEQTDPNNRGTLVNFDDVMPGHFATARIPLLAAAISPTSTAKTPRQ